MSLHPTAKEKNLKLSVIRHFTDNIYTALSVPVLFDTGLDWPGDGNLWVVLTQDYLEMSGNALSMMVLTMMLCSREDPDGIELAALRDDIMPLLANSIPVWDTDADPWTIINRMTADNINEGPVTTDPDGSKYKAVTLRLRFANKVTA
jgi:hypothetical protein